MTSNVERNIYLIFGPCIIHKYTNNKIVTEHLLYHITFVIFYLLWCTLNKKFSVVWIVHWDDRIPPSLRLSVHKTVEYTFSTFKSNSTGYSILVDCFSYTTYCWQTYLKFLYRKDIVTVIYGATNQPWCTARLNSWSKIV